LHRSPDQLNRSRPGHYWAIDHKKTAAGYFHKIINIGGNVRNNLCARTITSIEQPNSACAGVYHLVNLLANQYITPQKTAKT
jgi:hypothetical protein